MAKYRPVPRTLSDIINQVQSAREPQPGTELLSPEQLRAAGRVQMRSPEELFQGIPLQPSQPAPAVKSPQELFGNQAFAAPGQSIKSLSEILPPRRQPTSLLPPRPTRPELPPSEAKAPSEPPRPSKNNPGTQP